MEEADMILMPDLFSFAYVPNWYSQLDMLAEMALPEPWRFKNPIYLSLIHISEPTRQAEISYAVFCLKKKNKT